MGNAYFPNVEVIGQVKLQACFDQYLNMMFTPEVRLERMKTEDPDSVFLIGHPDYPASIPPGRTFKDELTLHVGNHTIKIIHMPGHTRAADFDPFAGRGRGLHRRQRLRKV